MYNPEEGNNETLSHARRGARRGNCGRSAVHGKLYEHPVILKLYEHPVILMSDKIYHNSK